MNILFATDGSGSADAAGILLARLKGLDEAHLEIVTVEPWSRLHGLIGRRGSGEDLLDSPKANAKREILARESMVLRSYFNSISTRICAGSPSREIVAAAREIDADLIVLGHRNRAPLSQAILGSVAQEVVDTAPCSVLVVPMDAMGTGRVLLACDGTQESETALEWVERAMLPEEAVVHVLSVPERVSLNLAARETSPSREYQPWVVKAEARNKDAALRIAQEAANRLRGVRKTAYPSVACGDAPTVILTAARRDEADIVAIGARARRKWWERVAGNTARFILNQQTFATLVARPRQPAYASTSTMDGVFTHRESANPFTGRSGDEQEKGDSGVRS